MAISLSRRHWIFGSLFAVLVGLATWVVVSLRNDDSILSILVREAAKDMGWNPPSTTAEALERMLRYQKRGRLDDAVKIGVAWTDKYPTNYSSNWIYVDIAFVRLEQAKRDSRYKNEKVEQAIVYRDKALACARDDMSVLLNAARISEFAGDISENQRCVQYGNTIKILSGLAFRMKNEQPPNGILTQDKRAEIEDKLQKKISDVQKKIRDANCD
jgi:hypothetical protein